MATPSRSDEPTAAVLIARFGLVPHPEGGHYAETWRAEGPGRPAGTAIVFLLRAGEVSHWHRIDSAEIWHYYRGAPLTLSMAGASGSVEDHQLSPDRPQIVVPPGVWQSARSTGAYTLVGCTVSPGFEFDRFELAPPGWTPEAPPPSVLEELDDPTVDDLGLGRPGE